MGKDTQKDRGYLINFALRMLCEAGGPDGLFQQKIKAIMMESLGFDNAEGLLDIIDARVAVLASMKPGGLGQTEGAFQSIEPVPHREESEVPVAQASDPILVVLKVILQQLEAGIDPTLDDVALRAGIEKDDLARILAARGIRTKRVRRDGKRQQRFLMDQLIAVRYALGISDR